MAIDSRYKLKTGEEVVIQKQVNRKI